jgi:hypothetical protein
MEGMKTLVGLRSEKTQGTDSTSSLHRGATNTKQTTSQSHKKKTSTGTAIDIALDGRSNNGGGSNSSTTTRSRSTTKTNQQRKLLDTVATATHATNGKTAHTHAASKKKKTTEVEKKKRRSTTVVPKDSTAIMPQSNIKQRQRDSNSNGIFIPRSTQLAHLRLELNSMSFYDDDDYDGDGDEEEEELKSSLSHHGDNCKRDEPPHTSCHSIFARLPKLPYSHPRQVNFVEKLLTKINMSECDHRLI